MLKFIDILTCRSAKVAAGATLLLATTTLTASADSFVLKPERPADVASAKAPSLTAADKEQLLQRLMEKRERAAATAVPAAEASDLGAAPALTDVAPADPVDAASEVPNTLKIGRNLRNTRAQAAANSTLAEPAAINNRNQVFYAGNFSHVEVSTNHGANYSVLTLPAGPADAPISCCDNDMAVDEATKTGFHAYLYVNSATDNGAVRIFVKNPTSLGSTKCSYLIDPGGANNDILPDYPHIAVSKNKLYLTINALKKTGGTFARIYRFDMASMRNCVTASTQTFTQNEGAIGQRVWVPAGGGYTQTRMMWVQNESSSSMRVFNWNEADAAPTSVVRTVASSNFSNPDCRGGIGNFDFIERGTAWGIGGFRTRCTMASGVDQTTPVLACFNHSAPQANRPNSYLRGTVFRISDRVLLSQPDLFSTSACWGYPAMDSNNRGNIGMSLAYGGKNGGGGAAVRGVVRLSTPSGNASILATLGAANRSDGRYGDYSTIHRYMGCSAWFGATAYSWMTSPVDAAADVDARWIEFGREGDLACYNANQ